MSERTFKILPHHMKGSDVENWQEFLVERFNKWDIKFQLEIDGDYGVATRGATASFMRAWGVRDTGRALEHGLTPWWRTKLRHDRRNPEEQFRFMSGAIKDYRRRLRDRYDKLDAGGVSTPCNHITIDSWGWVPGVHDGIDINTGRPEPLLAVCRAEVVRVSKDGWWGLGAPANPSIREKGDGIVIIRSLVSVGPIVKGMNICYGHAEHAVVRVGQRVDPGDKIAMTGLAVTYHTHWMINNRNDTRGTGDRNPRPHYDYCRRND